MVFASRPRDQNASATPAEPPARKSTAVSVRIWRTTRPRVEPSAVRSANSLCRVTPRARSSPEMLAQATSIINPTAPNMIQRVWCIRLGVG